MTSLAHLICHWIYINFGVQILSLLEKETKQPKHNQLTETKIHEIYEIVAHFSLCLFAIPLFLLSQSCTLLLFECWHRIGDMRIRHLWTRGADLHTIEISRDVWYDDSGNTKPVHYFITFFFPILTELRHNIKFFFLSFLFHRTRSAAWGQATKRGILLQRASVMRIETFFFFFFIPSPLAICAAIQHTHAHLIFVAASMTYDIMVTVMIETVRPPCAAHSIIHELEQRFSSLLLHVI